jgi:hypothetical protein
MKPEEIAAYIGAAAWVPQIIQWLYKAFIKPKLRIIPNSLAEVGFTSFGPIFNIRMAFLVENRDLIIDGLDITIRHESGQTREFRWAGLGETFSEITDAAGNKQIVSKDQTPIAIKIGTESLQDRFVRFQEPAFHAEDAISTKQLVSQFNFLKEKSPDNFVEDVLDCKEYFDVTTKRKEWFWWSKGKYSVTIKPRSPQNHKLIGHNFSFNLLDSDIVLVKKNLDVIEADIRNIIISNKADGQLSLVVWSWANVSIMKD